MVSRLTPSAAGTLEVRRSLNVCLFDHMISFLWPWQLDEKRSKARTLDTRNSCPTPSVVDRPVSVIQHIISSPSTQPEPAECEHEARAPSERDSRRGNRRTAPGPSFSEFEALFSSHFSRGWARVPSASSRGGGCGWMRRNRRPALPACLRPGALATLASVLSNGRRRVDRCPQSLAVSGFREGGGGKGCLPVLIPARWVGGWRGSRVREVIWNPPVPSKLPSHAPRKSGHTSTFLFGWKDGPVLRRMPSSCEAVAHGATHKHMRCSARQRRAHR